jgi:transposase-like protein
MGDLPQIARVDNVEKLMQIVYADESTRKDKTLAYLNQTELIDYNANRLCDNGHQLTLKKNTKTDGWWWRCSTKGCQQTKSIRLGTFFNESRLAITQVLLLVLNFAFEFLNTTMYQISGIAVHTVAAYKRRLRLIILTMFNKNDIRIGGEGRIVEIDESLFIKVKHNRGRDILRPKVWVFGLYERATADQPKRVLFFKVDSRDAVTLLNIIYNHVLPGTTILSDCWAAYNRIIDLDRQYDHRTVNHSLTFVAPDGTHTNSIESTWRAAKRQFKEMNGVSRLYLQAYLDEYCWRLENGNRNGWMVYESIIRAIRDYFRLFPDANAVLDQTIHRENHIINRSVDDELDFGDFNNEIIEPLELGDINNLTIPSERMNHSLRSQVL